MAKYTATARAMSADAELLHAAVSRRWRGRGTRPFFMVTASMSWGGLGLALDAVDFDGSGGGGRMERCSGRCGMAASLHRKSVVGRSPAPAVLAIEPTVRLPD